MNICKNYLASKSFVFIFTVSVLTVFVGLEVQAQNKTPEEGSCEETIETHGFLSRGQFQCGFRSYGGGMLESARTCSSHMQKDDVDHWLESGMKLYDFNEGKRGHAAMCASLLADFPKIL